MSEDDYRDSIQGISMVNRRTLCSFPGCNRLTSTGPRCQEHTKQKALTHGTTRWKRVSAEWRRAHPFCEVCGSKAEHVDHIHKHHGIASLFWAGVDQRQLQSLCAPCHRLKSGDNATL